MNLRRAFGLGLLTRTTPRKGWSATRQRGPICDQSKASSPQHPRLRTKGWIASQTHLQKTSRRNAATARSEQVAKVQHGHQSKLRVVKPIDVVLGEDVERLHVLIARHAKLSGSARAQHILANWKDYLPKFRKVMPVEYRRALEDMERMKMQEAAE